MSTVQYKQLWKEHGYGRNNPLSNTIHFLLEKADEMGLERQAVDVVLAETFQEIARGRKFSVTKCPCGCGTDKSGTAVTHYMRDKLVSINRTKKNFELDLIDRRWNLAVSEYVKHEAEKAKLPSRRKRTWLWITKLLLAPVSFPLPLRRKRERHTSQRAAS